VRLVREGGAEPPQVSLYVAPQGLSYENSWREVV